MAPVSIHNLDDHVTASCRELATRTQISFEPASMTEERLQAMLARLETIRAMTPKHVRQTPPEDLLRDDDPPSLPKHHPPL